MRRLVWRNVCADETLKLASICLPQSTNDRDTETVFRDRKIEWRGVPAGIQHSHPAFVQSGFEIEVRPVWMRADP
eukprot:2112444-Rhodomonas_salina.1